MSISVMTSPYSSSKRAQMAAGQPISALMAQALENADLLSLAAGFVDEATLPTTAVRQACAEIMADHRVAQAALQYGTTPGIPKLRSMLLERFLEEQRVAVATAPSVDQVVVTAGSNQLLHLIAESLLDPGDIVLCTAPTYFVFLGILANVGGHGRGVATDQHGMIPESLDEQLKQIDAAGELGRVKAIYLVPYFDNPQGITTAPDRLARIVEIAKRWSIKHKIHVIADEAYRELRYAGPDEPSARCYDEDGDTVIVAGTFSKSFSPGIRVGWGILPSHLVDPVCEQKGNIDFGSPNFSQAIMTYALEHGQFDAHLDVLRAGYAPKLQAMLDSADEFLGPIEGVSWTHPSGGLYIWARMPTGLDAGPEGPLFRRAIQEGMLYVPGQYCFPSEGEPIQENTMRLSFGVQTVARIRQGMQALAMAIHQAQAAID
ncbi:MAG: PLP-dependent aminotransferase family protein [Pirellulaceae bacterium]|nr:PLP-dependent aminotransferase family protein [Pirellulaceae bacterium]